MGFCYIRKKLYYCNRKEQITPNIMKKILFIVGSLREGSFNRQLAREAEQMIGTRAEVTYLDYKDVPLINQDIEFPEPEAVSRLRATVKEADALWATLRPPP